MHIEYFADGFKVIYEEGNCTYIMDVMWGDNKFFMDYSKVCKVAPETFDVYSYTYSYQTTG